jgi:AcrR family transcriptional regulator
MNPATATTATTAAPKFQRSDARRNRERVIAAARELLARDGLDAQMDEIARAAGVGVGTVYRHFATKDELIEALAFDRFERLREVAEAALAIDDPLAGFEHMIRGSAAIQTRDRSLSEVLTSQPDLMMRAAQSVGMEELTRSVVERAKADGSLRAGVRWEDVPMFMCALAGTFKGPFADTDRYVTVILDGLRAPVAESR